MKAKKTTYHHGDLRQQLISAAEDLIAKKGIEAVSMRMLSRYIGVSHTAAYRHFQDKQELLCVLAYNGFAELERRFQELDLEFQMTPIELILGLGRIYIDFALENPDRYRIMFGHVLIKNRNRQPLNQAVRQTFAHLLSAIEKGQSIGVIRTGNPLELASVSWSMVHGLSQLVIDGQLMPTLLDTYDKVSDKDFARLAGLVLDTLVAGLLSK